MVHQCLPGAYESNINLKVQRIETPIILDLRVSMVCFVQQKHLRVGRNANEHSMLARWVAVTLTACWLVGLQLPLLHAGSFSCSCPHSMLAHWVAVTLWRVIVLQAVPASSLLLSYSFLAFHRHYWFRSKLIELENDLECGLGNHSNYRNRCINSV